MDSYGAFPALISKQNHGSTLFCQCGVPLLLFSLNILLFPPGLHDFPYLLYFHSIRRGFWSQFNGQIERDCTITLYKVFSNS